MAPFRLAWTHTHTHLCRSELFADDSRFVGKLFRKTALRIDAVFFCDGANLSQNFG